MKNKNKIGGQVMIGAGFFMILVNALNYIIRNDNQFILGTIGLLFIIIGVNLSKRR